VPITNGQKQVIGVVQMINKPDGKPFIDGDLNTVEASSLAILHNYYCINVQCVALLSRHGFRFTRVS